MAKTYAEEKERKEKMAELERMRLKALRDGDTTQAQTGSVVRVVKKQQNIEADVEAAEKVKEESKSILDLGLSARTEKALTEAGIETVKELEGKTKEELVEIKGVGEKAAEDILKAIK
jgi:DNA-directed RNA polymerase alpha subunit